MDRRTFFLKGIPDLMKGVFYDIRASDILHEVNELDKLIGSIPDSQIKKPGYFDSYASSYPLLAEITMADLIIAAKQIGVDVTDKSKLELAKEVFGGEPKS